MQRQYETVIIITPVYSEDEFKKAREKYIGILKNKKSEIIHEESWGLKQLAYPIKKKTSGYYYLFEYKTEPNNIAFLEKELSRDAGIMRFMTSKLDKYAIEYNDKKRKGLIGKKVEKEEEKPLENEKREEKEQMESVKADDPVKAEEIKSIVDSKSEGEKAKVEETVDLKEEKQVDQEVDKQINDIEDKQEPIKEKEKEEEEKEEKPEEKKEEI